MQKGESLEDNGMVQAHAGADDLVVSLYPLTDRVEELMEELGYNDWEDTQSWKPNDRNLI